MTVVPSALQLAGWIPAWWRGAAGGDDLVGLVGPEALGRLTTLRVNTAAVTAYCPELGVGALPGPKRATEAAVAAGEAVILQARDRGSATLLLPQGRSWVFLEADAARPVDFDLHQASADMAEAVIAAEREVREAGLVFSVAPRGPAVRPLPPDAGPERHGLLVRAVRVWTAVAAIPPDRRTPSLRVLLGAAARATLAAYTDPAPVARDRRPSDVRWPA